MDTTKRNQQHNNQMMKHTSKFISLILRHKPETIDISLDEHGWAWGSLSHVFYSDEPVQIFVDQPLIEFDDVVGAVG